MPNDANPLARHGGLTYLEIPAREPQAVAAFYESVLGWKIDRRSERDFRFADADMLLIGRFVADRAAAREGGFVPFVYVVGIDAAVARAGKAGGEVCEAIRPENDIRVVRLRDPAGNVIGLWEFGKS